MTKEQLEKIRKRKHAEDRIVYTVFDNDEEATALHIVYDNELFVAYMMLKRVFETKEEAEWHHKTYAEHIERFEPPMWEEIEKSYDFYFYIKDIPYAFHVNKDLQCIEFSRDFMHDIFMKKGNEATKENYEKACEIVRDLFKKEEK